MPFITAELSEWEHTMADANSRCDNLAAELSEQRHTISKLRSVTCAVVNGLEGRINAGVLRESSLQNQVERLTIALDAANSEIAALSALTAGLKLRLDESIQREATLFKQLEEAENLRESTSAEHAEEIGRVTILLDSTSEKLKETELLLVEAGNQLSGCQENLAQCTQKSDQLSGQLETCKSELAAKSEQMESLRSRISTLTVERNDALKNSEIAKSRCVELSSALSSQGTEIQGLRLRLSQREGKQHWRL